MSAYTGTSPAFISAMGPVARELLGEPNAGLSSRTELRFGSRGSLCVDLVKGTFFDNEVGTGGGVIQFVMQKAPTDKPGALKWLVEHKHLPASEKWPKRKPKIVETYRYVDEHGVLLFGVSRLDPKDFRQCVPDGNGGWRSEKGIMQGVRLVPYRLPKLIEAVAAGRTIYIAEGEKGVAALESLNLVATCSPGGAGKWRDEYDRFFTGADVVVLSDNDPQATNPLDNTLRWHPDGRPVLPGQDHTANIAKHLQGVAAQVRVLMLPRLPLKGDVFDWITTGGTRDQLEQLATLTPNWTQEQPKAEPASSDDPQLAARQAYLAVRDTLDKNNSGAVLATHANLVMILKRDPLLTDLVEFNSFSGLHMLRKAVPVLDKSMANAPGPYPRPWDADDITRLLAYVQKSWAHNFKKATVEDCLLLEGRDNEVHDVRDYLASLRWDGTRRLDTWLTMTFGCLQDDYHKAVASKFLIAAVRRVRKPGCKHDHLIVLEGPQGIGKSTVVSILFSADWTADQISDLSSKDAAIDLRGKWGVELPEIEHLIKADIETVKAFLSRATDHYRPPYGKHTVDVPRQCVLVGTTNATEYLRDATGNRRIWPVKCLSAEGVGADIDWVRVNRDQLWAEAAHREAAGESIWLDNAAVREVATGAQAARLSEDPWQDKVQSYIAGVSRVTVPELFDHALFVPTVQQTKAFEMRVANILKMLGWEKKLSWDKATAKPFKAWFPQTEGG